VVETPGQGVEGLIAGRRARLGRASFVGLEGVRGGETELWFAYEGETRIPFRFSDQLRPDAAQTIAALQALGLSVEILSGDLEGPVARAAQTLHIDHWRSGQTPQDKAAVIDALTAQGRNVLMVGDGLNDTAALAKAHEKSHATLAYTEQTTAKMQMAELERIPPEGEAWADKLEHIRGAVLHHIFEEEGFWFLEIKDKYEDQAFLDRRFVEEYERYAGERSADDAKVPGETRTFDRADDAPASAI
jgi:hypothetical protein